MNVHLCVCIYISKVWKNWELPFITIYIYNVGKSILPRKYENIIFLLLILFITLLIFHIKLLLNFHLKNIITTNCL